jgi:hypothetical protein
VFLNAHADESYTLDVDFSGTNGYLPDDVWARPIELELLRFGIG